MGYSAELGVSIASYILNNSGKKLKNSKK